jgi:CDP-diglyceride synthetase
VAAVLLFVIFQAVPWPLLLILAVCLYLVWVDIRQEDVDFQVKAWWFLLVFLLHVVGYLIFRGWIAMRRRRADEQA